MGVAEASDGQFRRAGRSSWRNCPHFLLHTLAVTHGLRLWTFPSDPLKIIHTLLTRTRRRVPRGSRLDRHVLRQGCLSRKRDDSGTADLAEIAVARAKQLDLVAFSADSSGVRLIECHIQAQGLGKRTGPRSLAALHVPEACLASLWGAPPFRGGQAWCAGSPATKPPG